MEYFNSPLTTGLNNIRIVNKSSRVFDTMADSRYIEKWFQRCEMYQQNYISVIGLTSSEYEAGTSRKRRKLKGNLVELLPKRSRSAPVPQIEEEGDTESTRALAPSRAVTPTPTPTSSQPEGNETEATENRHTNYYRYLMDTVILDDLSFRKPFTDSDVNGLTEDDLILHGVRLYHNAHLLRPQELKDLPFIPRPMVTGDTMSDCPFLDPLLVVLWDIGIEDMQWMLNTLPWRAVDRPIRTGRSLLEVSI